MSRLGFKVALFRRFKVLMFKVPSEMVQGHAASDVKLLL